MKKLTQEEFINKSKAKYGKNAFDYSLIQYVNSSSEIVLICKKHGNFKITPSKHLKIVGGCPFCSKELRNKRKKMTTEEYKELVINKHNNLYDLSKTIYNGMKNNVIATCFKHGDFNVNAYNFVHSQGCPKCRIESRSKNKKIKSEHSINLTTKDFILKSKNLFKNFYSYKKTDLEKKDNKNRICITCPIHGDFWQNPYSHLKGHGCRKCSIQKKSEKQVLTTEEYIKKCNIVHNFKYDYRKTYYRGCYENIEIICPLHGSFIQKAYSHLNGHGCPKCANEQNSKKLLSNTKSFIEKAKLVHGNDENYNLVNYQGAKVPVTIICKKGHKYSQIPNKHLSGHGCPYCLNTSSKAEKEINNFIQEQGFQTETNNRKILGNTKEIDIYIPSKKIAIEFNGLYWHSEQNNSDKNYHLNKTIDCEKQGIDLIHIFEDEWQTKKDICKSLLKKKLGCVEHQILTTDCQIKEITVKACKDFLEQNYIFGNMKYSISYGLFYENNLLSLMCFLKIKNGYKIVCFSDKLNTIVIDGANKIFEHFKKEKKPSIVECNIDRRWNFEKFCKENNFIFNGYTKPNYNYIIGQERLNKNCFSKHILISQGFDKEKTEHEIMLERGIYRIYDCGSIKYLWKNKIV